MPELLSDKGLLFMTDEQRFWYHCLTFGWCLTLGVATSVCACLETKTRRWKRSNLVVGEKAKGGNPSFVSFTNLVVGEKAKGGNPSFVSFTSGGLLGVQKKHCGFPLTSKVARDTLPFGLTQMASPPTITRASPELVKLRGKG